MFHLTWKSASLIYKLVPNIFITVLAWALAAYHQHTRCWLDDVNQIRWLDVVESHSTVKCSWSGTHLLHPKSNPDPDHCFCELLYKVNDMEVNVQWNQLEQCCILLGQIFFFSECLAPIIIIHCRKKLHTDGLTQDCSGSITHQTSRSRI